MGKHIEQTDEATVPDNYPDIRSIICAHADAVIRGKDCRKGSAAVTGEIIGTILYSPEDRSSPKELEFRFPFTCKIEDNSLTENASLICVVKVTAADGRVLNSRKAMLRTEIGCSVRAFEKREYETFALLDQPETLQVMHETYAIDLPKETSEKAFTISDHLKLEENRPPVTKLYAVTCCIEMIDQKLVANKAVFKGNIVAKMLYLSEDDSLYTHTQKFPFSQYCELMKDYDEEELELYPVITGYEVESGTENDSFRGLLTVNVLMQCAVIGKNMLHILKDAYSTTENLQPVWHQYQFQCCVDRNSDLRNIRHQIKGEISEILDVNASVSYSSSQVKHGQICITTPVTLHLLGRNKLGEVISVSDKIELVQEISASDTIKCLTDAAIDGNVRSSLISDGIEIMCDVSLSNTFICEQNFQTLCGGNTECLTSSEPRPSVIIRNAAKSTNIWDLAKQYRSKKDLICEVNELHEDVLAHDQMLLIPIG